MLDEIGAEVLRRLRREEARMRIGELVELGVHGGEHVGVAVAKARDRRAARGVDVLLAGRVPDADALTPRGHGILLGDSAMHDAGHGASRVGVRPSGSDTQTYRKNSGEMRLGRNSDTLGHTMTSPSTTNMGISMIMVSLMASRMRMPAIEQAIIRHSP